MSTPLATIFLFIVVLIKCTKPDDLYDFGLPIDTDDDNDTSTSNEKAEDYAEFNQKCHYNANEIYCRQMPSKCINLCNYNINFLLLNSTRLDPFVFKYYRFNQNITIRFFNVIKLDVDTFNGLILNENIRIEILFVGNMHEKLTIESHAFRSLLLFRSASLKIKFVNYKTVEFKHYSLCNWKQIDESTIAFHMDNINHLVFKRNCSNNWKQYTTTDDILNDNDDIIVYDSNNHVHFIDQYNYDNHDEFNDDDNTDDDHNTVFRINATNVHTCEFEPYSFSNMILGKRNTLQIIVNRFNKLDLGPYSFFNIIQNNLSVLELNLIGNLLGLNSNMFTNIIQYARSKLIVLFDIRKSNICFAANSFTNLVQNNNSTVQVQLLTRSNRISFASNMFNNLKQYNNSFVQVYAANNDVVLVDGDFVFNLQQINACMFDVWFSNTYYVVVKSKAFNMIRQYNESVIRLSSTSSNEAHYVQEPYAFNGLYQDDGRSEIIYDFTPGLIFDLKTLASNESGSVRKLSLHEYELTEKDFCNVFNLTTGLKAVIRLAPQTHCSCLVYYLYAHIRVNDFDLLLDWLKYTPYCYQNHISNMDNLDFIESNCGFDRLVRDCVSPSSSSQVQIHNIKCTDIRAFTTESIISDPISTQPVPYYVHVFLILVICFMLIVVIVLFVMVVVKLNKAQNVDKVVVGESDEEARQFTTVAVKSIVTKDDVRTSLISADIYDNMI
jgi:hypothetical protein